MRLGYFEGEGRVHVGGSVRSGVMSDGYNWYKKSSALRLKTVILVEMCGEI